MELQGAPPTCDSRSVYMNEYTKGSAQYEVANYGGVGQTGLPELIFEPPKGNQNKMMGGVLV